MLWKPFAVLIAAAPLGAIPVDPTPIPAAVSTTSSMPNGGYGLRDSDAAPPVRFQRDTTVRVATVSTQNALELECGKAEAGKVRAACIRGNSLGAATIILPNPCLPQFAGQDFAWRLCHELGHKEGWGPDHEP